MFKCFAMHENCNTMNACASAPVSSSACSYGANQSANNVILRRLDTVIAVSIFVIADLARIIINEIIINLLAVSNLKPGLSRA